VIQVFRLKVVVNAHPSVSSPIKHKITAKYPFEVGTIWGDKAGLIEQMKGTSILVTEFASREVIEAGKPTLKFIQSVYRGINGIDLVAAKEHKIIVSHTASNLTATAEHCFALMLACAKKIAVADRYLRKNSWAYGYWSQEFSILLEGKTLAVIGLGAIGQALAKRALAFDMKVLGIRRSGKPFPGVAVHTMDNFGEVLAQADFVAVTLPLTKDTEGIVGSKEFNLMKKSAVFINTARGKIVDQEALYHALKNRQIACAGIDVWYKYPKHSAAYQREDNPPGDFPFHELDNLVMTPHRGGFVSEAEAIGVQQVVDNILLFHKKKPIERKVNLDAGY
jgi:glyoxylate reductase